MSDRNDGERDEFFDPPAPAPTPQAPAGKLPSGKKIAAALLAAVFLLTGFLAGWFGRYYALDEEVRTFLWAKSVTEKNYYLPVDEGELYESLYGLLGLDPYTKLYSPDAAEAYFADAAGDRKGMYLIGFGSSEDRLTEGDASAATAFISAQSGPFWLRCGFSEDGSDAQNYLVARREYRASYVSYRDSETSYRFWGETLPLRLTETNEPLKELDGKTAYLRIDEFSGNAAGEFLSCLSVMKERGRERLILDLRTNGGGYLDILGEIASHLLRTAEGSSPVVLTAHYRDGGTEEYHCPANDFSDYFGKDAEICLLADENTASASEALIGALVDYGTVPYSKIFLREDANGTAKTFGKGIMQTHFTASSGAVMKLTAATVHWPLSGRCIHGVGVTPADGAKAVKADLIWGTSDPMLERAIADLNS